MATFIAFIIGIYVGYKAVLENLFSKNKIKYVDVWYCNENIFKIIRNYLKI